MKLNTGRTAFPIEFDNGDKDVIYFNPYDKGIQDRINAFESHVNEKIEMMRQSQYQQQLDGNLKKVDIGNIDELMSLTNDERNALKKQMDVVSDISEDCEKSVKEELDVVFASKISDVVFRYTGPFDVVVSEDSNGNEVREMYIVHFLRALATELNKIGGENQVAMKKHLDKYVK